MNRRGFFRGVLSSLAVALCPLPVPVGISTISAKWWDPKIPEPGVLTPEMFDTSIDITRETPLLDLLASQGP